MRLLLLILILFLPIHLYCQNNLSEKSIKDKIVIKNQKGTIYELLSNISNKTGYLFVYGSNIVNNNKNVKIKGGEYTIEDAIYKIITSDKIDYAIKLKNIGNHILIYRDTTSNPPRNNTHIDGYILDKDTKEPIIYANINIPNTSLGTLSNENGFFTLKITPQTSEIEIIQLGYNTQKIPLSIYTQPITILLEKAPLKINELIIKSSNPYDVFTKYINTREDNYNLKPAYLTTTYTEGIEKNNKVKNLTQGEFKIYKSAIDKNSDQIKMLTKKQIYDDLLPDTLNVKISGGLDACLKLDIIKEMPDFLTPDLKNWGSGDYTYWSKLNTEIDGKEVQVVSFEQKKNITEPLFKGDLYFDFKTGALIEAQIEVNPKHVDKAINMFIQKRSKELRVKPKKIIYSIAYRNWEGIYYINHIRGDLFFKIRNSKKLDKEKKVQEIHTWFEMITNNIENKNVIKFSKEEQLPLRVIFKDR